MLPDGDSTQVSGAARPRGCDRRAHPRVRAFPGGLSELLVAEVADFSGCFILNLGEGGIAVQLAGPPPPFSEFKVHFDLDCGALSIDAKARPAWHDGKGNLGICFVELADECRDQLVGWLNGKRDQLTCGRTPDPTATEPFDRSLPVIEAQVLPIAVHTDRVASARPPDGDTIRTPEIAWAAEPTGGSDTATDIVARACELTDAGSAAPALADQSAGIGCQASLGKTAITTAEIASARPPEGNGDRVPEIAPAVEYLSGSGSAADIVATARELTHADGAALALPDKSGSIVCRASLGKAPTVGDPLSPSAGLSGQCIRTGQVVTCEDADLDLRVPFAVSRDLGLQSIVVVPIQANGETVGVLEVTSCAKAAFTSDHITALQQLAKEASPLVAPAFSPASPSISDVCDLHDDPVRDLRENLLDLTIATPGAAITHPTFLPSNGDHGAAQALVPDLGADRMPLLTSDNDPVYVQNSKDRESAQELISMLRASASREVSQETNDTQPMSFLRYEYTKLVGVAKQQVPKLADFSPKSWTSARQVPRLWTLILIGGTVLVGAFAGWVLLLVKASADFALHFAPPPVPHGRVQLIRSGSKPAKSHPGSIEKRPDGRVELPEELAAKQILSSVDPKYPEEAALRQISGVVSLTLLVDRSGSVRGIEQVSGNRFLADAAKRAVWQWQYRRFLFRGQAVETLTRVRFLFTLPGR